MEGAMLDIIKKFNVLTGILRDLVGNGNELEGREFNPIKIWDGKYYSALGLMWLVEAMYEAGNEDGLTEETWMVSKDLGMLYAHDDGRIIPINELEKAQLVGYVAKWFGIDYTDCFRLFGYGLWPSGYFVGRAPWNISRYDIRLVPMTPGVVAENIDAYVEWLIRTNEFNDGHEIQKRYMTPNDKLFYEISPISLQ